MIKKYQNQDFFYSPMLVSNRGRIDDVDSEEEALIWKKFETLSEQQKDNLAGSELIEKNKNFQVQNNLTPDETGLLSLLERRVYFGDIKTETLLQEIVRLFGAEKAGAIESFVKNEVLTLVSPSRKTPYIEDEMPQEKAEPVVSHLQKIQILQALSKFGNLGNQMISGERIRIKSQPEPVRGSLYNWIKCYRDELGVGQHSTVERGQFLFRSENGKRLTPEERERVNLILKSLEENYALDIDGEKQVIVFPEMHFERALAQSPKEREGIASEVTVEPVMPAVETLRVETPPTPTSFFVPKPAPQRVPTEELVVQKFKPSTSPYEKMTIPSQSFQDEQPLLSSTDVTGVAEKLKREPKPEWIKGAFTKESIPEKVKAEAVTGTMSFSLNHVLPVEQKKEPLQQLAHEEVQEEQSQVRVIEKRGVEMATPPAKPRARMNQFHIRPVSRGDV